MTASPSPPGKGPARSGPADPIVLPPRSDSGEACGGPADAGAGTGTGQPEAEACAPHPDPGSESGLEPTAGEEFELL